MAFEKYLDGIVLRAREKRMGARDSTGLHFRKYADHKMYRGIGVNRSRHRGIAKAASFGDAT
jgi:hypothetical protein